MSATLGELEAPLALTAVSPQTRLARHGVQPLLLAVDALALIVAGVAVGPSWSAWATVAAVAAALYQAGGLYRSRLTLSLLDDLPRLVGGVLIAAAVVSSGAVMAGAPASRRLLFAAALAAALAVLLRAAAYKLVVVLRASGYVAHPTLVLGAGRVGGQIAGLLMDHPEYGLRPVGFLDGNPFLSEGERRLPLLGSQQELAAVIEEYGVQDVVVAFGTLRESEMVDIIRTCDRLHCEIFYVPRLYELHHISREMDQVWGLPLIRLRRAAFRTLGWRMKRLLDVGITGFALALLTPLMLLIALAVRLEGGSGVLFRQERVGLDGRRFQLLKFRSMRPVNEGESQTQWNIADDPRVGRVGKVLRSTSLDELPQLLNILRGDMSLVGPRPERPFFVSEFTRSFPRYPARHRVPSGLTGWAQVHGLRGDTSIGERARFDNYYIENWTLWSDVKILLRTFRSVLRREGG